MIIVRLIGGLGNQLFQYSLGRQLAKINNTELKLDVAGFAKYPLRSYGLGVFQIQESFATRSDVRAVAGIGWRLAQRLRGRIGCPPHHRRTGYILETEPGFDPEILQLPDNVYLDGYWQSEQYFSAIMTSIRRELTVMTPQYGRNLELATLIRVCNSVSIHIRRGDYVTDPQTNRFHGECSLDYYATCISEMSKMTESPHFFVFSDDTEWARANLKLSSQMTFVDHNGPSDAYEDLRLMSQCRHHVIANSSFSWWGAWLNASQNKIVFAPKQWLAAENLKGKSDEIIPAAWNRV